MSENSVTEPHFAALDPLDPSRPPIPLDPASLPAGVRAGIVVGNPKPASRTFQAAARVVAELTGRSPEPAVDLAAFGAGLLDWSDAEVSQAVETVSGLDLVVFASPTYKATYTGLLKLFLDRFPSGALEGVVAVPLMLGAGPGHALAPEVFLRPVLAELGASVPTSALYLLDGAYEDAAAYEPWLTAARPRIAAALAGRAATAAVAQSRSDRTAGGAA